MSSKSIAGYCMRDFWTKKAFSRLYLCISRSMFIVRFMFATLIKSMLCFIYFIICPTRAQCELWTTHASLKVSSQICKGFFTIFSFTFILWKTQRYNPGLESTIRLKGHQTISGSLGNHSCIRWFIFRLYLFMCTFLFEFNFRLFKQLRTYFDTNNSIKSLL